MFSISLKHQSQRVKPSKIVCIGRNYADHIQELGNTLPEQMVIFTKPNSAIGPHLQQRTADLIHYECELCFVIQKQQLAAVGLGFDLTKRQLQSKLKKQGLPWERAKSFNGSAVFSQFVKLPEQLDSLSFQLLINQTLTQHGQYKNMLYKPRQILQEISSFMLLEDNDIIMTGTPSGVGELKAEDHFNGQLFSDGGLLLEQHWQVR